MVKLFTPGEKIKNIRIKYGLSQQQLCGKGHTRNYISLIENDREQLNWGVATFLIDRLVLLKKIRKGDITPDYLIESEDVQAKRILKHFFNELEEIENVEDFSFKVNEVNDFILNYSAYICNADKFDIYKEIYLKYYKLRDLHKSKKYVYKVIDYAKLLDQDITTYVAFLSRILGLLNDYSSVVHLEHEQLIKTDENAIELSRLKFNVANAFYKLEKYKTCIQLLDKIKNEFKFTYEEEIKNEILKGECYRRLGDREKSLSIYCDILNSTITDYYRDLIYANIAALYLHYDNELAINNIELALEILKLKFDYQPEIMQNMYFDALEIYIEVNNFDKVKECFFKIIEKNSFEYYSSMISVKALYKTTMYSIKYKKETFIEYICDILHIFVEENINNPKFELIRTVISIMQYYKGLSNENKFNQILQVLFLFNTKGISNTMR